MMFQESQIKRGKESMRSSMHVSQKKQLVQEIDSIDQLISEEQEQLDTLNQASKRLFREQKRRKSVDPPRQVSRRASAEEQPVESVSA